MRGSRSDFRLGKCGQVGDDSSSAIRTFLSLMDVRARKSAVASSRASKAIATVRCAGLRTRPPMLARNSQRSKERKMRSSMVKQQQPERSLAERIADFRAELDAWIDAKAQEMKADAPDVPLGVLRNLSTCPDLADRALG
jgi:hypothetical protein